LSYVSFFLVIKQVYLYRMSSVIAICFVLPLLSKTVNIYKKLYTLLVFAWDMPLCCIQSVRKRLKTFFFPRCPVCGEWCKLHWLLLDTPSFDWNTRRTRGHKIFKMAPTKQQNFWKRYNLFGRSGYYRVVIMHHQHIYFIYHVLSEDELQSCMPWWWPLGGWHVWLCTSPDKTR
jgi:hypothetical protein